MAVILSENITFDARYFVAGQAISSENLNKHSSLYFSEKRCYVVRDLEVGYSRTQNKLFIYPGAAVVSYVLVTIKEKITINVPNNNYSKLYIVISYNPDQCFTVPPLIQLITSDEYNPNYMCLLGYLIRNEYVDTSERPTPNLVTSIIPMTNVITYSFDVSTDKFKIRYPYGNFELLNIFMDGVYLNKDMDYDYDDVNKKVYLTYSPTLSTITTEIKQTNGISAQSRYVTKSCTYRYIITQSDETNRYIYLNKISNLQELMSMTTMKIFLNGVMIYPQIDYTFNVDDAKIEFLEHVNINSQILITFDSQYYYDFNPYYSYNVYGQKILVPTSTVYLPFQAEDEVVVFHNGILEIENLNFTLDQQRKRINFYNSLTSGDDLVIYCKKADDITSSEITILATPTNQISFTREYEYEMMVFVNGLYIEPDYLNYELDSYNKKIIFPDNLPAGNSVILFIR